MSSKSATWSCPFTYGDQCTPKYPIASLFCQVCRRKGPCWREYARSAKEALFLVQRFYMVSYLIRTHSSNVHFPLATARLVWLCGMLTFMCGLTYPVRDENVLTHVKVRVFNMRYHATYYDGAVIGSGLCSLPCQKWVQCAHVVESCLG